MSLTYCLRDSVPLSTCHTIGTGSLNASPATAESPVKTAMHIAAIIEGNVFMQGTMPFDLPERQHKTRRKEPAFVAADVDLPAVYAPGAGIVR